jgi:hypothetical protein
MYGEPKDVSRYRPFGCRAWVHLNSDKREKGKHNPRGQEAIYLGFEPNTSAWSYFIPDKQQLWSTNQAQFDKHFFPFHKATIIDKYHLDCANDILFQDQLQFKWTTDNKLHISNYKGCTMTRSVT